MRVKYFAGFDMCVCVRALSPHHLAISIACTLQCIGGGGGKHLLCAHTMDMSLSGAKQIQYTIK